MKIATAQDVTSSRDCSQRGCPREAESGSDRCNFHKRPVSAVSTWNHDTIVDAIQKWAKANGKFPMSSVCPSADDGSFPTLRAIKVVFDNLAEALAAAGSPRNVPGGRVKVKPNGEVVVEEKREVEPHRPKEAMKAAPPAAIVTSEPQEMYRVKEGTKTIFTVHWGDETVEQVKRLSDEWAKTLSVEEGDREVRKQIGVEPETMSLWESEPRDAQKTFVEVAAELEAADLNLQAAYSRLSEAQIRFEDHDVLQGILNEFGYDWREEILAAIDKRKELREKNPSQ